MKSTDPGERDQPITIRQRPDVKSSSGADIPGTPVDVVSCWAKITRVIGGNTEGLMADVLATKTWYMLDTPYLPGIVEKMEIVWGSRMLDIIRVVDLGPRPLNLILYAEERR